MADDDFSGFSPLDQQPPVDPLMAWHQGTGLTPEEVAQHIHDPQGFAANMEARGIPPPDFHLSHDGEGNFTPLQAYNMPTPSTGVVPPSTVEPPTQQPPAPPGVPGGQVPWGGDAYKSPLWPTLTPQEQESVRQGVPPMTQGPGPFPPPTPPGMTQQRPYYDPLNRPEQRPTGTKPEATTPPAAEPTAGKGPLDLKPSAEGIAAAQQKQKAAEEERAKKLDDFAKMMQGIKMPQRPPPNPVGTPAAPHHTAINAPQALSLLGLLGQPGSQQTSALPNILARLLGRVG